MKKTIFLIPLLFWNIAHAEVLTELEATPPILSEPNAKLLITEVNFKNDTADWVKMVYHSPSSKPMNLKGISFGDDNLFKTVESDFIIASGQEILITFKSTEADTMPYLYTDRSGLTGTTEQIIIFDQNGEVIDAVCWTSSKPTTSELSDQNELFEKEGWNSAEISSCLFSETIKTNESIKRKALIDTNSKEDWQGPSIDETEEESTGGESTEKISPPLQEIKEPESKIQEKIIPPDIIDVEDPLAQFPSSNKSATKSTKKSSSEKSSSTSKSYRNGSLSRDILITEIMPNPDGDDSKKEWIEITNTGENSTNLGNWQVDDGEGGSKPYTIPDSINIEAGQSITIKSKESKLSLGNKEDMVRIFDFQSQAIDETSYEEAASGQSYSLITIQKEDGSEEKQWMWTAEPTPEKTNPIFHEFTAEITSEPQFEKEYTFEVTDEKGQAKTVIFHEELIAGPLAKATFTKGSTILITAEPQNETRYSLKKFEILEQGSGQNELPSFLLPSLIGTIILVGGATFFILQKKIPWQERKSQV